MRLALLQLDVDLAQPFAGRVERVCALVRKHCDVDLLVLPELWPHGAFAVERWAAEAQPIDGGFVAALREAAAGCAGLVHAGSFVERAADGRLYNTSLLIGRGGTLVATYRKIHRFGFGRGEGELLSAGSEVVVHEGVGLATCYDLRFPELFRAQVGRGAELAVVVAGWPERRIEHWSVLTRARAVEDQLLVVACNAAGRQGETVLGGRSLVVGPWGEVLAEAGTGEEVIVVEVDRDAAARARERFPVLRDRVL